MDVTAASTTAETSTVERILIATDGGPAGSAAIRWVLDHLGDLPARLELICAAEDDASSATLSGMRVRIREQERLLRIVLPRVDVASSVRFGHPAEVLERSSDSCDLVVIGTHHGFLRRRMRGVPQRMARTLSCPLVVVPREWISGQGPVVLGVARDASSDSASDFAMRAARRSGRPLRLVHVWDMPGIGMVPVDTDLDVDNIPERQRLALERSTSLVQEGAPDLSVEAEVRQGALVATLTAMAQDASLLVIGRPSRSALAEALFGSVGRGVLSDPPCPVAIVPSLATAPSTARRNRHIHAGDEHRRVDVEQHVVQNRADR